VDQLDDKIAVWVTASILKHITDGMTSVAPTVGVYSEDAVVTAKTDSHVIVRFTGPDINTYPDSSDVAINVDCLCSVLKRNENLYSLQALCGLVYEILTNPITIYRLGSSGDGSSYGCLELTGVISIRRLKVPDGQDVKQGTVVCDFELS
jgi:hypothetical protein